ncbi:DUF2474 domain-containing protein [Candidatus Paraluminiphilus aquimaris]|uniref:DUF2474 domain-containing protein n=1 Tax=Candidatus Paraluminiphilus aquimaris TaxID=2518994 RepID=A0ABY6Q6X1_9GAMM|nr:DUF2474 domain-containing protein [Candidatus Paraluminiphilus aquimaris]
MATTESKPSWLNRILWFVGIWAASVVSMSVIAFLLRSILLP